MTNDEMNFTYERIKRVGEMNVTYERTKLEFLLS